MAQKIDFETPALRAAYDHAPTKHPYSQPEPSPDARTVPWMAAATELVFFGAMCCALVGVRAPTLAPAALPPSDGSGHLAWAAVGTLLLGSIAMARTGRRTHEGSVRAARRCLLGALGCGTLFVIVRGTEFARLIHAGVNDAGDVIYLTATSLHGLHGILATGFVAWAFVRQTGSFRMRTLDRIAVLWHAATFVGVLLFAHVHSVFASLEASSLAASTGLGLSCTVALVVTVMGLLREDGLHLALVTAAFLVAGTGVAMTTVRSEALASADPALRERPADSTAPFGDTVDIARIRGEVGDLGNVEAVLAAALAPPPETTMKKPSPTAAIAPAVLAKAKQAYDTRCASCHGSKGGGDGPGAFAIRPPPRDYTDPEWQASVTDEELAKAIAQGGASVGKSFMMPASSDLRHQPEIVEALVAMVRSFGEK